MNSFDWSRLKNYGLWVSIASLVPLVLNAFGVDVAPEKYQPVVNTVLTILVTMGILNNPTTLNKGYLDDSNSNETEQK